MVCRTPSLFGILHRPVEYATYDPPLGPSSHNSEPSTEGQAIKSMFFARSSTYYLRFTTTLLDLFAMYTDIETIIQYDPKKYITSEHRWELPGNYPVFTVVMVISHYVERIWRILVTPILIYNIYDHK